ncbi:MAG: transporter substrate-binding protein [Actinomycetia bacterium]|nr:transporter substrate-binding protein [Actinomycetes bacterium]
MPRRKTDHPRTRWLRLAALVAALALAVAACGGTSSGNASSGNNGGGNGGAASTTLRTAFVADMQVPDPDIFYETEGNQVVMSTYEGLVRYQQNPPTNALEGLLATSWEKSADGKTYTFHLRSNVKFEDGTPMDSAAAKASFERRPKVNQGPAYMLAQVASYGTPDPLTFVVNLKQPVSAFMDYLAAPYGPKLLSPTAMTKYAKGGDFTQGYLKTHSIGTGPYYIKSFTLGQQYVLAANPNYWGAKPKITTIEINIVPDLSTQQLKIEGGDLDILHNLPAATTNTFKTKSGFQVITIPALQKSVLKINPQKAPFNDLSLRQALRAAIDRNKLTSEIYGNLGTVSTQMLPAGMQPAGTGLDSYTYDPTLLPAAVKKLPSSSKSITIAYASGFVNDQRTAEAIQKVLADAGFNAKVTPITLAQFFALRDQPESKVPNLLVETANPDAAHPDTYLRIFFNTGGFLNYVKGGSKAADAEMDRGLYTNDPAVVKDAYEKASQLVHDSATFVTIADVKGTFVATTKLKGWTSTGAAPLSLNFQSATLG